MSNQLSELYLSLLDFIEPLRRRLQTPESLEYLFYRYGWSTSLDDAALARIQQALALQAPLTNFVTTAEALRDKLAANPGSDLSPTEIETLVGNALLLIRALAEFSTADLSALGDPFGRADFWESVAENVLDDLLEEYLRVYQPGFYLVLRAWGIIRYEPTVPTEPSRQPYTRTVVDWAQALAAVRDPLQALKQAYHWGDPTQPFAHADALSALANILRAVGVASSTLVPALATKPPFPADPTKAIVEDVEAMRSIILAADSAKKSTFYQLGFEVFPAARNGETRPSGLMVRPILQGGAGVTLPLGKSLGLSWTVAAALDDVVGFAVFPDHAELIGGDAAVGTSLTVSTTGKGPWYLLGKPGSSRIEVASFSAGASLAGSVADPEVQLRVACTGADGAPGCKVVIPLGGADQFVQTSVDQSAIDFSFSPEIIWSSKSGLTFNGKPTLDIDLPLSINLGPISLTDASITFGEAPKTTATAGLSCRVGTAIRGKLGPVTFVIDKMGFVCNLTPYTRDEVRSLPPGADAPAFGSLGVDLDFAPPVGVGLSIDTTAVSGGGYIKHEDHQYSGAFGLSVSGVAVKAYGLIDTVLPGGVPGYSFLVVLSAEFSPSVQLPFGFTLDGVGGLLGIHRTIALDHVQSALWSHHFDGLLFPKDPVASAPSIMSTIESYFPAVHGRYVVGPLAKIGWGHGIVEGLVALLIELPEPVKLLLLGEISVLLPKALPQLELHIDFDGGVDFGQKLAFFDASLHDSRIESFPITGDMAFRWGWGDTPVFALAIGGFNPHFQPPPGFPSLKRVAITIGKDSAQLVAQAYFALTSNTLQFGGHVELTAGGGGFNVHGWLGLDALCEWQPFSFIFDLTAGVEFRHGTSVLASVHLDGHLSGPTPWHVSGEASLSLLFFDVSVHFDTSWGDQAPALPPVDPGPAVRAALADRTAWSSTSAVRAVVTLQGRPTDAGDAILLDPAGALRIAQRVVPLGQPITRFGGAALAAPMTFSLDGLDVLGEHAGQPTTEEFAVAQFTDLSDADKLSLPSFTRLAGGVEVGADRIDLGTSGRTRAVVTKLTYDTSIIDSVTTIRPGLAYTLAAELQLAMNLRAQPSATGLARYAPAVGTAPRVTLAEEQYVIAGVGDLKGRGDITSDGTKLGALRALTAYLDANPSARGQLQVVLSQEAA